MVVMSNPMNLVEDSALLRDTSVTFLESEISKTSSVLQGGPLDSPPWPSSDGVVDGVQGERLSSKEPPSTGRLAAAASKDSLCGFCSECVAEFVELLEACSTCKPC